MLTGRGLEIDSHSVFSVPRVPAEQWFLDLGGVLPEARLPVWLPPVFSKPVRIAFCLGIWGWREGCGMLEGHVLYAVMRI